MFNLDASYKQIFSFNVYVFYTHSYAPGVFLRLIDFTYVFPSWPIVKTTLHDTIHSYLKKFHSHYTFLCTYKILTIYIAPTYNKNHSVTGTFDVADK